MLIVELALQGLRGLAPLLQFSLLPGVNVARCSDARVRRTIVDAIFHTLHPDAGGSDVVSALVEPGPGPARTALTLQARDGNGFRVMREMTAGTARLLRYSKETQQFKNLSQDAAEVAQYLRVQLGLPSESNYERLFVLSPDSMASLLDKARSRRGGPLFQPPSARGGVQAQLRPPSATFGFEDYGGGAAMGGMGGGGMVPALAAFGGGPPGRAPSVMNPGNALVRSGLEAVAPPAEEFVDLDTKRSEYKRLRKLLEATRNAQGMHQELDQLSQRRGQIESGVEHVRQLSRHVEELRPQAERFAELRSLPPGIGDRLRGFNAANEKHAVEMGRLSDDKKEAERARSEAAPQSLSKDRYFLGGVGAMALFILLAILLGRPGLALFNVLGALMAAAAAFHYVAGLELMGRQETRLQVAAEREQKVIKQFELETNVTRKLMTQLGVDDTAELLERIQEAEAINAELNAAETELAAYEADAGHRADLDELGRIRGRMEEIEAALGGLESSANAGMGTQEIIRKIEALGREIQAAGGSTGDLGPSLTTPSARAASAAGIRIVTGDLAPRPVPGLSREEDDDAPGYGGGYSTGSGGNKPSGGGQSLAGEGLWAIGGYGGGGFPPSGGGGGYGSGYGSSGGYATEGLPVDPTPQLSEALSEVLVRPFESLQDPLAERLLQYLKIFVGPTFERISYGPRGEVRLVKSGAVDPVPFYQLEGAERLLVDAALRLTWLEQAAAKARVPVLIDDPFVGFDPPKRKIFRQTLSYIGKVAQVLVLSPEGDLDGNQVDLVAAEKKAEP